MYNRALNKIRGHSKTTKEIAASSGVSENTIKSWLYHGKIASTLNLQAVLNSIGANMTLCPDVPQILIDRHGLSEGLCTDVSEAAAELIENGVFHGKQGMVQYDEVKALMERDTTMTVWEAACEAICDDYFE
jgi:hypothetical protein